MNNYEFCARWVAQQLSQGGRVLDYGCGRANIVAALRESGIAAFGCDTYGECPEAWDMVPAAARPYVTRMPADRIPFDDASFDCVVSNQVIEHVVDLDAFVAELARVLRPGGVALHLFPHRGVWLEGHANIPFLHWFPKRSRIRISYAVAMSVIGFGLPLLGMKRSERYARKCEWLDQWTHYRSLADLRLHFGKSFSIEHVEPELFDARAGRRLMLPADAKAWLTRAIAGCAMVVRPHTIPVNAPALSM